MEKFQKNRIELLNEVEKIIKQIKDNSEERRYVRKMGLILKEIEKWKDELSVELKEKKNKYEFNKYKIFSNNK